MAFLHKNGNPLFGVGIESAFVKHYAYPESIRTVYVLCVPSLSNIPSLTTTGSPIPPYHTHLEENQKVHIHLEFHSVCPLVGIGTPNPSHTSECVPPEPKGGGAHSPAGEGWGGPNSEDWRKSLALCLLCVKRTLVCLNCHTFVDLITK